MRKSLVILLVIVASLALCGVAFAQVCGPVGCPPAPKAAKPAFKQVAVKAMVPVPFNPKGPKCAPITPPKPVVSMPGECYAVTTYDVPVPKTVPAPIYRNWCKGSAKGQCPIACGLAVKWEAKWLTKEKVCDGTVTKWVTEPRKRIVKPDPCPPPEPLCF